MRPVGRENEKSSDIKRHSFKTESESDESWGSDAHELSLVIPKTLAEASGRRTGSRTESRARAAGPLRSLQNIAPTMAPVSKKAEPEIVRDSYEDLKLRNEQLAKELSRVKEDFQQKIKELRVLKRSALLIPSVHTKNALAQTSPLRHSSTHRSSPPLLVSVSMPGSPHSLLPAHLNSCFDLITSVSVATNTIITLASDIPADTYTGPLAGPVGYLRERTPRNYDTPERVAIRLWPVETSSSTSHSEGASSDMSLSPADRSMPGSGARRSRASPGARGSSSGTANSYSTEAEGSSGSRRSRTSSSASGATVVKMGIEERASMRYGKSAFPDEQVRPTSPIERHVNPSQWSPAMNVANSPQLSTPSRMSLHTSNAPILSPERSMLEEVHTLSEIGGRSQWLSNTMSTTQIERFFSAPAEWEVPVPPEDWLSSPAATGPLEVMVGELEESLNMLTSPIPGDGDLESLIEFGPRATASATATATATAVSGRYDAARYMRSPGKDRNSSIVELEQSTFMLALQQAPAPRRTSQSFVRVGGTGIGIRDSLQALPSAQKGGGVK